MTKTIEAKPVREARAEARRMARKTELSYQQALDKVARDAGAEHWAAFAAMHPSSVPTVEDAGTAMAGEPRPRERGDTIAGYLRSAITGDLGAMEDRVRSGLVVRDAQSDNHDDQQGGGGRRRLWASAARNVAAAPLLILAMGWLYLIGNMFMPHGNGFGAVGLLSFAGYSTIVPAAIFLLCLCIGDQPGMERRRAAAWTAMLSIEILGVAAFLLSGFDAFDHKAADLLGIGPETVLALGIGAMLVGGQIRKSIHALMALGAALGPKGEGSSLADPRTIEYAVRDKVTHLMGTEAAATETDTDHWWHRAWLFDTALAVTAIGCVLSFAGVGLDYFTGIDAMPIAYLGLALLAPLMIVIVGGMVAGAVAGTIGLPDALRRRAKRYRIVRNHERANGA